MPGNKRVNSNLNIDGSIKLGTVPNLGTTATYILTQNPSTKEISQRTNSEIISDLNLATTSWVSTNYIPKSHPVYNITQNNINSWNLLAQSYLNYQDIRQIRPNSLGTQNLRFGFTSWNNDTVGPYADFIHFGGYQDASGGSQNLLVINKSGFGIRQYQAPSQSSNLYSSYVDYWHTGNFNPANYLPLTGGTLSGQLTLSNSGLKFLDNPYGGGGDGASMYISSSGDEQLTLNISVSNDADDIINLITPSVTGLKHNGNTVWDAGNFNPSSYQPVGNYVTTDTTQNITGSKTFIQNPIIPQAIANNHAVNLEQLNTKIGNIQIGGRNLALNSKQEQPTLYFPVTTSEPLIVGQVYTLSADVQGTLTGSVFLNNSVTAPINEANFNSTTAYRRVSVTFTFVKNDYGGHEVFPHIYNVDKVKNLKLEKGNKATDWTPAPEDQVSDWNTTDVNSFSFIKNKPTADIAKGVQAFNWNNHAIQGYLKSSDLGNYVTLNTPQNITGHKSFEASANIYYQTSLQAQGNGSTVFPGIGFYQPGVVANQLNMTNDGWFQFVNSNSSDYASLRVKEFETYGSISSRFYGVWNSSNQLKWYINSPDDGFHIVQSGVASRLDITSSGITRINTDWGYLQLGPQNGSRSHIYSNLPFYMNQALFIEEGKKAATESWADSKFSIKMENAHGVGFSSGDANQAPYIYHNSAGYRFLATQTWVQANFGPQQFQLNAEGEGGQDFYLTGANSGRITNFFISSRDGIDRNANNVKPITTAKRVRFDFVNAGFAGSTGNFSGLMTYAPWDGSTGSTGDSSYQLAFINETGVNGAGLPGLALRKGIDETWGSWYNIAHSGNLGLSYSGNTLSLIVKGITVATATINAGNTYTAGSNLSLSGNTFNVVASPTFAGNVTASAFYESSLRSLKTNIQPFEKSGLELVNELDVVTFDRKDGSVKNKIGIIADDSPEEFLSKDKDTVDLYKTIFIQAKAIQELTKRIEELENR